MIRNLILGAVAAVAIGFGGQAATAGEPYRGPIGRPVGGPIGGPVGGYHPPRGYDRDFVVLVRHGYGGYWQPYGRYETRREAERVEWWLERRGYRARVEEVRGRGPRW